MLNKPAACGPEGQQPSRAPSSFPSPGLLNRPLKILTLVAWPVKRADYDDLSCHSADIFVRREGYWFLKYWPRPQDEIEVLGISRSRMLRLVEQKFLRFYPLHAAWFFLNALRHDIVICFHSQIGLPLAFLFALFRVTKPLILCDVEGLGRKAHWSYRWLIRRALSRVTLLLYFSSAQKAGYATYYPEILNRCRFIHLGLDLNRFPSRTVTQGNYLVAVGYQDQRFRDWETLVGAYRQLKPEMPLLIVGKAGFTNRDVKELPIPPGIRFQGQVSLARLNEIIGGAYCMILPLPERGHSYGAVTLLGAQALGKAVLTARCSGIEDYLEDGVNGFFYQPGNAENLAKRLAFLLAHPDLVSRVGASARKVAEGRFSEYHMGTAFAREVIASLGGEPADSR